MRKKKIILQTNSPKALTGLGENGRYLMEYLLKNCKDKYEIVYYCTQTHTADPILQALPCRALGSLPSDQHTLNQLNQDPGKARSAAYGGFYIDEIVKNEKPDALWMSDDAWSFSGYQNKNWFSKINPVLHITLDSLPLYDEAFDQAAKCKNYVTWANFGAEEMKRIDPVKFNHVKTIHGMFDTKDFDIITKEQKLALRKQFNIDPKATIFLYLSRNQLRKSFPAIIEAFAEFKRSNPDANAKLFFHTSFGEKGSGWDIQKLMAYHGVKPEDVLATYVCKNCGKWEVKPYQGEDLNCPYCGAQKSQITANIAHGVPDEEMKLLHGIADATINSFSSGGQERSVVSSLLCGLCTAVTNYSCGTDYCSEKFVFPLDWHPYYEPGTNFTKAATSIKSIKGFIEQIYRMSDEERRKIGQKGREWAAKTFSIETIGKQWEDLFDSLPYIDWNTINLDAPASPKNPNFALPPNYKEMPEGDFLTLIYKEILGMDEKENIGDGHKYWMNALKQGQSREDIINFFRQTAAKELQGSQQVSFESLIDKDRPNRRILFLLKEDIGDVLTSRALLKPIKDKYPNHDLYYMTDPKFFEILEGDSNIYKLLPYISAAESEMAMMGAGTKDGLFHVYFHPGIHVQRQLQYLTQSE